jgi:hypothetical protein
VGTKFFKMGKRLKHGQERDFRNQIQNKIWKVWEVIDDCVGKIPISI